MEPKGATGANLEAVAPLSIEDVAREAFLRQPCKDGGWHEFSVRNWPRNNIHCCDCGFLVLPRNPALPFVRRKREIPQTTWELRRYAKDLKLAEELTSRRTARCRTGHHAYWLNDFRRKQKCINCGRLITRRGRWFKF